MNKIINEIKQICPQEYYEIGYDSLSGLLNPEYSKYKYGISLARKLDGQIINQISNGSTDLYYALYFNLRISCGLSQGNSYDFSKDLLSVEKLVNDPSTNLYQPILHAPEYIIFREILLIADHNAYHLGELVLFLIYLVQSILK